MKETPRYPGFADFFKDLIKNYSEEQGQEFLASVLVTSQSTISRILKGYALPTERMVKQINILWNVDITGEVQKAKSTFESSKKPDTPSVTQSDSGEIKTIPRLPITAAAGTLSEYLGGVLANECEQMPVVRNLPEYDFTMIIKGNSMEPKFEGGDEVACKKVESVIEWGKTYVLATRDGAVLKRLYKSDNGVRCVSYNHEEYPDFEVKNDDILGVYRVVGLIRV